MLFSFLNQIRVSTWADQLDFPCIGLLTKILLIALQDKKHIQSQLELDCLVRSLYTQVVHKSYKNFKVVNPIGRQTSLHCKRCIFFIGLIMSGQNFPIVLISHESNRNSVSGSPIGLCTYIVNVLVGFELSTCDYINQIRILIQAVQLDCLLRLAATAGRSQAGLVLGYDFGSKLGAVRKSK